MRIAMNLSQPYIADVAGEIDPGGRLLQSRLLKELASMAYRPSISGLSGFGFRIDAGSRQELADL